MTQRTVTYNTDTHRIVPVEPTVEMTNRGAPYLTGLTSYAYPTADKVFGAMLAAAPEYVSDETCANGTTPESEPEFTPEEVAMAEAPWSYVAPIHSEPVNKRLLDVMKAARKFVFSYAPDGGLLPKIDSVIASAEQAYEHISDEEIAKAVRHLYASDTAAEMGLPDDLRTARAVLSLMEGK